MGIRYYGRYGVYDGPRLVKLIDYLDACKVPIVVCAFLFLTGVAVGAFPFIGVGALGLSLYILVYLFIRLVDALFPLGK